MSRFKNVALGTMLVAAVFIASVLSLTASASAAVVLSAPDIELLPTGVVGPQTLTVVVPVDATGFQNLTLSFTIRGVDDIEPNCGGAFNADCFEVFEGAVSIVGPFYIPCSPLFGPCDPIGSLTPFGPIALASADTTFNLTFEVFVSDHSDEGAVFSSITIEGDAIVPPVNNPPVANAGPDQPGVVTGATVNLDGSLSSDPDLDAITFLWSFTSVPVGMVSTQKATVV